MKIYVASSWRNAWQPDIVRELRAQGHEVYDFKNPRKGDKGFHWSEIDPVWKSWSPAQYTKALNHDIALAGFYSDFNAMQDASACVLVAPCGRSAHLEAGYFAGHPNKRLYILIAAPDLPQPTHSLNFEVPCLECQDDSGCRLAAGIPPQEPELMYAMADKICLNMRELLAVLDAPSISMSNYLLSAERLRARVANNRGTVGEVARAWQTLLKNYSDLSLHEQEEVKNKHWLTCPVKYAEHQARREHLL